MPDGSDHNQGYECDGNQGIGKTNPAHTGCAAPLGPSEARINIDVDCFSVSAQSSKDISFVEVTFADGSVDKFQVNSPTFTRTFGKAIRSVTVKSGTTIVTEDVDENCVGPGPGPGQRLSVDANCFNVSVTSSHDIDQIVIRFADGSTITYPDSAVGTTFTSQRFDNEVASVTAVSGNLTETATVTEDCVVVEPCDANPNKPDIQPCVPPQGPIVGPVVIEPPIVQPKIIRHEVVQVARQRPPGELPVTGLSISWFLLLGIALIGAGLMMLYPSRRRCQ